MLVSKGKSNLPRKVRKSFFEADLAHRYKQMSAPLSKELKASVKVSRLPIHKGDEVIVMAGKHKAQTGVVNSVCRATRCVSLEGVQRMLAKGFLHDIPFKPCKLRIVKLMMNESREKIIKRRAASV